jgi:carbon-monoxide dehydrogenase large subunit
MNEIAHAKFGIGAPLRRLEDKALITGRGRFTDDEKAEGMLHGYVLRSPYAFARFTVGDVSQAAAHPGVHLVLTAADIGHLAPIACHVEVKMPDGSEAPNNGVPILADGIVRHVGDAVAFIVADSVAIARDAAEMIEVDYEPMDAIVDTAGALQDGAPLVYPSMGTNLAFVKTMGKRADMEAAFARADRVTEITIINNRVVANFLEPRSCLAEWVDKEDRWSVKLCSQGAHNIRASLAEIMGCGKEKIRVRTGDVGGGFGTKVFCYREYPLTMEAARRFGRPVKWTSDRTEHFVADAHGRDNVTTARMAMDKDGRFLGMDVLVLAAMGGYLHSHGPFIPALGLLMATGSYDVPALYAEARGIYTNTTPVDAYRGAGRPEAAYVLERLVDRCALDAGLSREEIRRRNFIRPEQMPYRTQANRLYDTGEFDGHLTLALQRSDWDGFAARNEDAKKRGMVRGIGLASYIEACAFAGSEPAFLELKQDGRVELRIGTQANGQGHATAYAQLAGAKLGLDYDRIDMRQGDTDELPRGGGTGGSRSVPLGGASVNIASEELAEKIRKLAGDRLEASSADIELSAGTARVVGTDRVLTFAEIAQGAANPEDLKAKGEFRQGEATYPNGTHVCEVEIDPETGVTRIVRYVIVDDFGVTVNPLLLAGQVHGGVAQGIGQCLTERTVYDEDGQLLTASLMDYCVPRADDLPDFEFETRNVPSTTNALGVKGAGEAGSIGSSPAVMNALGHALRLNYGIGHVDMPATPSIVWRMIRDASQA